MKWNETIASNCRYSECAERIFGEAEILYELSESDYQGNVEVFAKMPDGRYAHYEYTYGSCSGCDAWDAADLSDEQIVDEMREGTVFFDDVGTFRTYVGQLKRWEDNDRWADFILKLDQQVSE